MGLADRLDAALLTAWRESGGQGLTPSLLATTCVTVLGVDGAGIGLLHRRLRLPLGSSDPLAALAEQIQVSVGEGPCLTAAERGQTVLADQATIARCWPVYQAELFARTPFRSAASIPLRLAEDVVATLDLTGRARDLAPVVPVREVEQEVAPLVAALLAEPFAAPAGAAGLADWLDTPGMGDRITVWTAIGLLRASAGLSDRDALAALRAYAYSHDLLLDELAAQLVSRRLPAAAVTPTP